MRYRGYSVDDIGLQLNLRPHTVQNILDRACAIQADQERVTYVREAELAKLDELEGVYLEDAITGNHKSTYLVLKLMERRAAVVGIDRSPPVQLNGNFTLVQILANMRPPLQAPIIEMVTE